MPLPDLHRAPRQPPRFAKTSCPPSETMDAKCRVRSKLSALDNMSSSLLTSFHVDDDRLGLGDVRGAAEFASRLSSRSGSSQRGKLHRERTVFREIESTRLRLERNSEA